MAVFQLDGDGNDLADPANVRYFLMSSLPHGGGVPSTGPGICQQNRNPLVANPALRALLVDLDQWVSAGADPPASKLPRVADGTLVRPTPQDSVGFPSIPGVIYTGRNHTGDLLPDVAAPLATYTGWNLRAVLPGANDGCVAAGMKVDFAPTRADRLSRR